MSVGLDRRLTPARPDLAAAHLKAVVKAEAYAEGEPAQLGQAVLGLHAAPDQASGLDTQLLFGEAFTIYDIRDGWAWGQAALDSYVGYARADGFVPAKPPTHRVVALATPRLAGPDVKAQAHDMLPMNAKLTVDAVEGRFARLADGSYVFAGHMRPLSSKPSDWVAIAEQFLGVPYLWGGKTARGLDCSGLIQTALEAGRIAAPRDTDMMEVAIGSALSPGTTLRRGDLIFWKGHVGLMLDETRLLHANAFAMQVTSEPFVDVHQRILASEKLDVRTIKRL